MIQNELINNIADFVIEKGIVSSILIQQKFGLNYTESISLIDKLAEIKIISEYNGSNSRRVLLTKNEWEERKNLVKLKK